MKREQIEELISAYLDNELSPPNRAKVETLVRSDLQAKEILQGYLLVRKAFQNQIQVSKNVKAPPTVARALWNSVDAAAPAATVSTTEYSQSPAPWNISRLKNPRIYAYPLAVIVCALLIGLYTKNNETQQADNSPLPNPGQVAVLTDPSDSTEHAPMSSDSSWATKIIQAPVDHDNILVVCQVESAAKMNTVFPKLFAAHSVGQWNNSTSGKGTTVYEINVSLKTFRAILNDFPKNEIEITGDTTKSLLEKAKKVSDTKRIRVLISVETP